MDSEVDCAVVAFSEVVPGFFLVGGAEVFSEWELGGGSVSCTIPSSVLRCEGGRVWRSCIG